ncbi:MAG: Flp pilus assembly complex ATPase component TadA [Fibrobacter sp.]|nr:Flp pilus assembly complex ATPase component TadA [Fibrobacter sp.]
MIKRIGSIIQSRAQLHESQIEEAAQEAKRQGFRLGDILLKKGLFTEREFFEALADQFSMEFIPDIKNLISTELLRELPSDIFKNGSCLPLDSSESVLRLAVTDPIDFDTLLQTGLLSDRVIEAVLTTPSEMRMVQQKLFEGDTAFKQFAGKISREYEKQLQIDESLSLEEIRQRTEAEPVVKMASLIFNEAIKLDASDIHIEPSENNALIRFRIDGMLQQYSEVSKWMYSPLTSRIKILADLDIAEKRVPQDGRIRHNVGSQAFDFRVSTLPTHYGEKTVIRILKHDKSLLDMNNLGIPSAELSALSEIVEKPQGMIFVTGPTGSGKSSTLFACLNRIRHKAINITTLENPIEYKLDGVNQVQINEKAGITFASALRSILRQDPDVILVGEIRDTETAQIAVQASQTGHLVLSTLHTNDAISAITRLRDLKIPGFLISSSLLAIIAQRLVRMLCPYCKKEAEISGEVRRKWESLLGNYSIPRSWSAVGCDRCKKTGYKGRVGVFELITVNEKIRTLIADDTPDSVLRKTLREEGFKSLINDGISKIEQGITTPEELLRVVLVEDIR